MNSNSDRVCVANLPPDIRIKDIDDFFRPFGRVVNIDVNNRSNPVYAYVQFDSARNAFNAVRSRHGYDYEGYTLQLRLIESEVMKSRDFTPPPPPPPMLNNYERQNNGGGPNNNYGISLNRMGGNFPNSFQGNQNSQWTNNNNSVAQQSQSMSRPNMPQQNMGYPTNNRQQDLRMQLETARPNMLNQFSNTNRSNMQQQFPNSIFSNSQHQHSNLNRSNMSQRNINFPNRSDILQQNMVPYSDNSRSTMQQQYNRNNSNMPQEQINMGFPNNNSSWNNNNNSSWNSNNNMNRNSGNHGIGQNVYNNAGPNEIYNSNDNYDMKEFDDTSRYTSGLSGSGRKWFYRYMQDGLAPEKARAKALGHRTVPYLREDLKNKQIPGGNTNAALETIGNTIISLLSTNQVDNFRPGPSSSLSQTPRNVVSKQQYLKSVSFLRDIKFKRNPTAKDEVSRKYHTQIVKDFEKFTRDTRQSDGTSSFRNLRNEKPINISSSQEKLEEQLRKKKGQLLKSAKNLSIGKDGVKRFGGAYKKRIHILMHEAGFSDIEAKALAAHPLEKLRDLIALKQEYDLVNKKTDFIPANKRSLKETPKVVVYRNDIKYLKSYQELKISKLSTRIITALNDCIVRIHKYEREQKLPLTGGKFVVLLQKIAKKNRDNIKDNKNTTTTTTATAGKTTATAAKIKPTTTAKTTPTTTAKTTPTTTAKTTPTTAAKTTTTAAETTSTTAAKTTTTTAAKTTTAAAKTTPITAAKTTTAPAAKPTTTTAAKTTATAAKTTTAAATANKKKVEQKDNEKGKTVENPKEKINANQNNKNDTEDTQAKNVTEDKKKIEVKKEVNDDNEAENQEIDNENQTEEEIKE